MEISLSDRGETEVEDLAHHGVKGMHWGVITKRASAGKAATVKALKKTGRVTASTARGTVKATRTGVAKVKKAKKAHDQRVAGKIQAKKEAKARKKFANKGYKKISDTELNSRIKRLEQEKRYRDLKADRHLVRGREVTRQILEGSLTKAGTYAGTKLLKSAFDNTAGGKIIKEAETAAGSKSAKKKAKKAAEAAEAAHQAAKEAYDATFAPQSPAGPPVAAKPKPKQIEKKKSYKQTKPSPKKKRYPRNPGSTAK